MKNLINATNLHSGGGVQVAASFISELAQLKNSINLKNYAVFCSSSVFSSLPKSTDLEVFGSFKVINIKGFSKPKKKEFNYFKGFEKCFTIFGPVYFKIDVKVHICGFAQPWIAYPLNDAYKLLPFYKRYFTKVKFAIQSKFFKSYDVLVVEAEHVKRALIKNGYKNSIEVISNTVSSIFDNESSWSEIDVDINSTKPVIGFIGRPYSHKNIVILKQVNNILKSKYNIHCDFVFTLSSREMDLCGFSGLENFNSVGEITLNQCPSFYKKLDFLIFPSLLECFSASPIEAMKMGVPILGSNLDFVSSFCKDSALYFDPLDASSIAETVSFALSNPTLLSNNITKGKQIVRNLPTASQRANGYVNLLNNVSKY